MRRAVFLIFLTAVLLSASATAYSAETNLGPNNFTVKVDSIKFKSDALKDIDSGLYVGLEGYSDIGTNFYLGAEVGYAHIDKTVESLGTKTDRELIFIPIELNLKYSVKIISHLIIDAGGGFSYNYAREKVSGSDVSSTVDEWLWGGQFFGDLNYKIGNVFIGANAKYQMTKSGKDFGHHFNNMRLGGQIGVMF